MKKIALFILLLTLLLAGCNLPADETVPEETSSPTPSATLTLTPSQTPTLLPTETATITPTPTIMPTIAPMTGLVTAPVNIRSRPHRRGERLGGLYFNQSVKIIGRNDQANWFWFIYPESPDGTAWVQANAINLQGEIGLLPIILLPDDPEKRFAVPPLLPPTDGTPLPLVPPGPDAMTGSALQLLNVRTGPGLGYLSMGTIPSGTALSMTGRLEDNSWFQIEYPSGPDGRAWVSGALVELDVGAKRLPIYNLLATPVTEAPPQTEEPTLAPEAETPQTVVETDTPAASPTPNLPTGIVTNQINVRSGPASSFASLGMLNQNERVVITARTLNGLWLQIEYPSAPEGKGWVAAAYINLNNSINKLPYFDNQGTPLPQP
jgi:uncharacterized protein YraI